jgi:hypothetical protein
MTESELRKGMRQLPKKVRQAVTYLLKRCMPDCGCVDCMAKGIVVKHLLRLSAAVRMSVLALALTACGCAGLSAERGLTLSTGPAEQNFDQRRRYIIHDTVHDDYLCESGYGIKGNAKTYGYNEARKIVTRHRVNEEGEYADTGSNKDYPLQIEEVKP